MISIKLFLNLEILHSLFFGILTLINEWLAHMEHTAIFIFQVETFNHFKISYKKKQHMIKNKSSGSEVSLAGS